MTFYQNNELETLFNVHKCIHHGAPFLAYLYECGGHKIMCFLMPFIGTCLTSVGIDYQNFIPKLLNLGPSQ